MNFFSNSSYSSMYQISATCSSVVRVTQIRNMPAYYELIMVNVFAETPEEKKELALHMYHNGHTYRTICKEVRLSPSTLSNIIKSESGYIEDSEKQLLHKSKETRALALYNDNKKPLEVAIELNISADEATNSYEKFQQIACLPLKQQQMRLQKEIEAMEVAKNNAHSQLIYLRNQICEQSRTLQSYKTQCDYLRNQLIVLYCHTNKFQNW